MVNLRDTQHLEHVNAALLEALIKIKQGLLGHNDLTDVDMVDVARAAIARARGEKS